MKKILLCASACALLFDLAALESIKGLRGNAVSIDGRKAYLVDCSRKPFDYSKGCTVSVAFRAREWAQGSALISNAGSFNFSKRLKNNRGFYVTGTVNKKRSSALMWSPEK